jgi:4-carboxymuconolactone decarboxylase
MWQKAGDGKAFRGPTWTGRGTARRRGHYRAGVTRLPYLRRDQLDAEGQRVWDGIVGTRGDQLVNADGGLSGPFNAFVHAPDIGQHLTSLGATVRFGTSIERRLSEVAIITVGARWKAEFEWWAHARMARRHGVPDAVVDAIGRREDPPFAAADERVVYDVAAQLTETGRLGQDAYDAARRLLRDTGVIELITLCGYYTLISFLLNAFAVPLPPGAAPQWGEGDT